jgi:TonB-linked SusC/RagA family outer membrane protein
MKKHLLLLYLLGFIQLIFVQRLNAQDVNPIDTFEQKVRLLYDLAPVKNITSAISYVYGDGIANVPGINRINTLSGHLTGFSGYNLDGLPGYENSTLRVRGVHTFSGNRDPLVLIDGRIDDINSLDAYDIESIVLLKDAAAAVMYGLRSANGIILVNTKKGKEGKIKVNVNMETSFSQPTRMPKYLDSYQYATLYNEAQLNDNPGATPRYGADALEAYRTGSDPYKYPDVNWIDEFLKKNYVLTRTNVNVSGGSSTAKYYVAANYLYNSGVFNTDKDINTYNTNTAINVMNIHGNLQLNIGRNLYLNADVRAKKDSRNAPGSYNANYAGSLFTTLYSTPFNAHPVLNKDGSIAGTNDYNRNPYGVLNYTGYSVWERSSISSFVDASYDMGDLIKGLTIEGRAGFNTFTDYYISRSKNFAVYRMNDDGQTYAQIGLDSELGNTGNYSQILRNFDHYIGLRYSREFAEHQLNALLMYERQQVTNAQSTTLSQNYQGLKGSLSYWYNNTYLLDLSFAYQGSEQYPKNNRYGFFPAAAVGWIISNESFMKNLSSIDLLKIRGSYGLTGNQVNTYFGYLGRYASVGSSYFFGTTPAGATGYYESQVSNPALTWEKCLKTNIGMDISLLKDRLSGSFDYFIEKNSDILIQNAITSTYGASLYMPEGKFENKGYEFQLGWNDRIQDFGYFISLNYSFAKNKIVYQNEQYRNYPWMYSTGNALDARFGYVFDRFYTENDNIASLPDQSLLGVQKPGDLKYKDLNDDGKIDENDRKVIGDTKLPTSNYGINFGGQYKGFDINVLFHGTGGGALMYSGYTYWDFYNNTGNVLEHHLDRWKTGDGQSAGYPRLSLSNTNNYQTSSYWLKDNSFVRLKYVEVGYTLPVNLSRKAGISKARIFINGNNLYCWDKIGVIDPELADGGMSFPIQRTISAGFNIGF